MINTHSKLLKEHGANLHKKLQEYGYVGNSEVVYKDFLGAVIETDALIDSAQKIGTEQYIEEEYFRILTSKMNNLLSSMHNFHHYIDNLFTPRQMEEIQSDLQEGKDITDYIVFWVKYNDNIEIEDENNCEDEWEMEL